MIFTDKQYNELKGAESYFHSIIYADYKRNSPRSLDEKIKRIYEEATGVEFKVNYSCPICVGKLYKTIGKLFYQDKADREVSLGTELSPIETSEKPLSKKVVANNEHKPIRKPKK